MEREDLERKRDEVELVADHRNRLADEEQAEVAVTQRREDLQAHSVTSMVTARGSASGGQSRGVSLGASVWGRQSRGVAGHQRVGRSASIGRESAPQRAAHIATRTRISSDIKTSTPLAFPGSNSGATSTFVVTFRHSG